MKIKDQINEKYLNLDVYEPISLVEDFDFLSDFSVNFQFISLHILEEVEQEVT